MSFNGLMLGVLMFVGVIISVVVNHIPLAIFFGLMLVIVYFANTRKKEMKQ